MRFAFPGGLALVSIVVASHPAVAGEWGGSVELGIHRTFTDDSIFKHAWDVGLGGHRRWRGHYYPGVFFDYRSVIDAAPATSFWYADLGLRFFAAFGHSCGRIDVGWVFRHIALDQEGVSSTVGGLLLGAAVGAVIVQADRGALDLIATSHVTSAFWSERLWIADIGLALSWRFAP